MFFLKVGYWGRFGIVGVFGIIIDIGEFGDVIKEVLIFLREGIRSVIGVIFFVLDFVFL